MHWSWRLPSGPSAPASSVATLATIEARLSESTTKQADASPSPRSRIGKCILCFTSQWFLVPQGTGITAVVLHQLRYQFRGLEVISWILWVLALVSLAFMLFLYIVRIILFPKQVWAAIKTDQVEIACLSCISISLTSLNQMVALTFGDSSQEHWSMLSCVLWWIDVVIALSASLLIPIAFAKVQPPGLIGITPAMLLPLISAITFAAGGGTIAGNIHVSIEHKVPMIIVGYLFLGLAMPLTIAISTLYLLRLLEGKQPSKQKVFSEMMMCGPWGQGSYALQALGQTLMQDGMDIERYSSGILLSTQATGPIAVGSMFFGLVFWGQGLFWWFLASSSIISQWMFNNPGNGVGETANEYSLTAWALVFPWGVFTNATIQLGGLLDSTAFSVLATVLAIGLVILWMGNVAMTLRKSWKRCCEGQDTIRRSHVLVR